MYQWKTNLISDKKHNAEAIGAELERLAKSGKLTAENVVEAAKDESSPLHSWFEWDDTKAAEEWRKQQARVLIASIVIREEPQQQVRAFFNLKDEGSEYFHVSQIKESEDLTAKLVEQAQKEMQIWLARYKNIQEYLQPAYTEIERFVS